MPIVYQYTDTYLPLPIFKYTGIHTLKHDSTMIHKHIYNSYKCMLTRVHLLRNHTFKPFHVKLTTASEQ